MLIGIKWLEERLQHGFMWSGFNDIVIEQWVEAILYNIWLSSKFYFNLIC